VKFTVSPFAIEHPATKSAVPANVKVERHAAAPGSPKPLYPN
jgi:hypothetical protein